MIKYVRCDLPREFFVRQRFLGCTFTAIWRDFLRVFASITNGYVYGLQKKVDSFLLPSNLLAEDEPCNLATNPLTEDEPCNAPPNPSTTFGVSVGDLYSCLQ